jgi:prepilin-type N-terminal cleavage/methylation domain-containing protein
MSLTRLRRDEGGYSLVEMITVMAIMSVVFAGLTSVFTSASKADLDMQNRFTAQVNMRIALDRLRSDAHCAYDVSPNTPNPWTTAQGTITFKITACSSGDVTWCTAQQTGSTTRWDLYRQAGTTCGSATPAVRVAKYLTTATPFTGFAHVSGCSCLASVSLAFPIGVNRNAATGVYRLQDTIYLRNSTRI